MVQQSIPLARVTATASRYEIAGPVSASLTERDAMVTGCSIEREQASAVGTTPAIVGESGQPLSTVATANGLQCSALSILHCMVMAESLRVGFAPAITSSLAALRMTHTPCFSVLSTSGAIVICGLVGSANLLRTASLTSAVPTPWLALITEECRQWFGNSTFETDFHTMQSYQKEVK